MDRINDMNAKLESLDVEDSENSYDEEDDVGSELEDTFDQDINRDFLNDNKSNNELSKLENPDKDVDEDEDDEEENEKQSSLKEESDPRAPSDI